MNFIINPKKNKSMITEKLKQKIVATLQERRAMFGGSDNQFAKSLGINPAIYNRLKRGETEGILSNGKWISVARSLQVPIGDAVEWKTAQTPVFLGITAQLEFCQQNSALALIADDAGIGKTYAAEQYAKTHKNVVYVDCSQVKSKQQLVRHIARQLGVDDNGKYQDVYEDLVYFLRTLTTPLIILDEAGDLNYQAFLELKSLQNRLNGYCGWYMMGADGLKAKINNGISCKKVGYAEIFDRYGGRFQRITPDGVQERQDFYKKQAACVIMENAPAGVDFRKMLILTDNRLRRVYVEIKHLNDRVETPKIDEK